MIVFVTQHALIICHYLCFLCTTALCSCEQIGVSEKSNSCLTASVGKMKEHREPSMIFIFCSANSQALLFLLHEGHNKH